MTSDEKPPGNRWIATAQALHSFTPSIEIARAAGEEGNIFAKRAAGSQRLFDRLNVARRLRNYLLMAAHLEYVARCEAADGSVSIPVPPGGRHGYIPLDQVNAFALDADRCWSTRTDALHTLERRRSEIELKSADMVTDAINEYAKLFPEE